MVAEGRAQQSMACVVVFVVVGGRGKLKGRKLKESSEEALAKQSLGAPAFRLPADFI
jgi:hypothetical protein